MMKICDVEALGGKGVNEVDSFQVCMPAARAAPASVSGAFWMDCCRSILMALVCDYYKVL